jgi:hypothetical protein
LYVAWWLCGCAEPACGLGKLDGARFQSHRLNVPCFIGISLACRVCVAALMWWLALCCLSLCDRSTRTDLRVHLIYQHCHSVSASCLHGVVLQISSLFYVVQLALFAPDDLPPTRCPQGTGQPAVSPENAASDVHGNCSPRHTLH